MAVTATAAFPQTPQFWQATITAANTNLDGTGTITELGTAGSDGSQVYGLYAGARATVTDTAVRFFISTDGGTTWTYIPELDSLVPTATVANTTANAARVTILDRETADDKFDLPASAKLGATIAVALAGGIEINAWVRDY